MFVMYGTVTQLPDGQKPVEFSGKSGREWAARTIKNQILFVA